MKTIEHTVDISAEPSVIWAVLTDTSDYGTWNPFITRLDGHLAPGERIAITVRPRERTMTFRPTIDTVDPERRLRWHGRLGIPGLFDACHEFILTPQLDGRTYFTQRETFTGILVPFMRSLLRDTEFGFAAMNHALHDETATRPTATSVTT